VNSEIVHKQIKTTLGEIVLRRMLGKGKSGYSYLAELNGQSVVLKRMHNEPCPYYNFTDNKVKLEVDAYNVLQKVGIPVPELFGFDVEQQYLVKAYLEGLSGLEWLARGGQDEAIIEQLFLMANKLQAHHLNIDYFPANFVIVKGKIYYIDYEINPYSEEWSLCNWGIYYWANRAGIEKFVRSGDWTSMNERTNSGIPIKAPFEEQVRNWREKFGIIVR
jgi:TP53 regulating kinase and related kinases